MIAQGVGLLSAILILFVIFSKNIQHILIFEILTNLVMAAIYFCLGGLSASGNSIIATIQTYIFFLFTNNGKKIPKLVIITFICIYGAWAIYTFRGWKDILPSICILFYIMAIMQNDPSKYRSLKIYNAATWIIYDIFVEAYTTIITHGIVLTSALIASLTVDKKQTIKDK